MWRLGKDTINSAYSGMKWTVQRYNFDLSLDLPFFFNVSSDGYPPGDNTTITRTNFFNISSSPRGNAEVGTTSTSSPSSINNPTSADQKSMMIEMGLGLGLGIPLGVALISIFFLVRRLRESKKAQVGDYTNGVPVKDEAQQFSYQDTPKYGQVHEISTRNEVHEAPGSGTTTQYL